DAAVRRIDMRRPVHRQFLRMAASHPFRSCIFDATSEHKPHYRYGEVLTGVKLLARLLRPLLQDDKMVGLWLPPGVGSAIANIAVTFLGKTTVNLNYTSSPDVVKSAVRQCGLRHILTARRFTNQVKLDAGPEVELIHLEDFRKDITKWQRWRAYLGVLLL